jgi:hypothetical protein
MAFSKFTALPSALRRAQPVADGLLMRPRDSSGESALTTSTAAQSTARSTLQKIVRLM